MPKIGNDWDEIVGEEFQKEYYKKLRAFLKDEYSSQVIYPDMYDIFNALKLTPFNKVKVVILGQDPYIKPGEAHGLSFSVKPQKSVPPSLKNIFKELHEDIGFIIPTNGFLEKWAVNGALMLNTVLTVRAGQSNSHKGRGWETFTDKIIQSINSREKPAVFMLWGNNAKQKQALITNPHHLVLMAAHPSPLAGGAFFGCRHFSKANEFLEKHGIPPMDWRL